MMILLLLLAAGLLGALVLLARRLHDPLLGDSLAALQALLTSFAIVVAAIWYFTERKSTPHADLSVEVVGARLLDDMVLLQATVRTRNHGQVLLEPEDWGVRLESVVPSEVPVDRISRLPVDAWPATRAPKTRLFFDHAIDWKHLRTFEGQSKRHIEPGELDVKSFDFLVRCEVQLAKLTVALKKPNVVWAIWQTNRESWWKEQALLAVSKICAEPTGSVMKLHGATA